MRIAIILTLSTAALWAQEPERAKADAELARARAELAQTTLFAQQKGSPSGYAFGTGPGFGTVGTGRLSVNMAERWWRNQSTAQNLGLTPDQQKKMDDIFQQHRLRLIDLNAALEKEEVTLEPLVSDDTLDDAKITAQIDRVAQARAELEKANGRMLLGIRKVLTPEQWRRLNPTRGPQLK